MLRLLCPKIPRVSPGPHASRGPANRDQVVPQSRPSQERRLLRDLIRLDEMQICLALRLDKIRWISEGGLGGVCLGGALADFLLVHDKPQNLFLSPNLTLEDDRLCGQSCRLSRGWPQSEASAVKISFSSAYLGDLKIECDLYSTSYFASTVRLLEPGSRLPVLQA